MPCPGPHSLQGRLYGPIPPKVDQRMVGVYYLYNFGFSDMTYFVYVLKSESGGRRYIGMTGDLDKRLIRHNQGGVRSTKPYRPWRILHT